MLCQSDWSIFFSLFGLLLLLIIKCNFITTLRGLYEVILLLKFFLLQCCNFAVGNRLSSLSFSFWMYCDRGTSLSVIYVLSSRSELSSQSISEARLQPDSFWNTDTIVGDDIWTFHSAETKKCPPLISVSIITKPLNRQSVRSAKLYVEDVDLFSTLWLI